MVSVITINYNQSDYTIKCVESLLKSEYDKFRILLIDNGSTLENYKELKEKLPSDSKLKLLRLENNRGYVGGINYGLTEGKKLQTDYFLILNNDTIIEQNSISNLVDCCIKYNNKAIVTGKVYHYDEPNKLQDVGYSYMNRKTLRFYRIGLNEFDEGQYDLMSERDMLDDVFWLFSMKLYQKIGGYSSFFWFNEEQADFALRAKKEGFKLIYTPMAKLWHKGSVSIGGRNRNPKLAYWHIQSSLILRYIHLGKINFLLYLIGTLKSILLTSLKSIYYRLKGDKSWLLYAYAKRKGFMYFLNWTFIKNKNIGKNPF
jgi:GT2 family glycosyltransferase